MEGKETASTGTSFAGLLCIAFIVLKLCNVIAWSWWWVLSPILIPIAIGLSIGIVWVLWYLIFKLPDEKKRIKSGMNKWAWQHRKRNKNIQEPPIVQQSKLQQRIDEVKKAKERLHK